MTGKTATASRPVYLSDLSPQDKPWDKHRHQSGKVQKLYGKGDFIRYKERIGECSRRLQFALIPDGEGGVAFHLEEAKFCRVRFCPICQWRRSLMWRGRFYRGLPKYLADHPGRRAVALTLTVRNCAIGELRETVDLMNVAFSRMTKRKWWPATGWVKSLEVTRGADGSAHPHFHVLMFVKPGYFSKYYIKQAEWRHQWAACMKINYLPSVHLQTVKGTGEIKDPLEDLKFGIMETLKYGVKPDDLIADGPWLCELTSQLHKTRAVSVGGDLKPYIREQEPEDLIHDEDDESELAAAPDDPRLIFEWHQQVRRYAQKLATNED
jgi:plasmid rolling circle replication initiator protein Rep